MSEEGVKFRFSGDAGELEAAVKRASDAVSGLASAASAVAGAFSIDAILSKVHAFVAEADDGQRAMQRFVTVMQASGQAVDPQRFDKLASRIQELTLFEDDAAVSAAAMMGKHHLAQTTIENMLPAVADLAAFMGRDLAGAADDVGRAMVMGGRALNGLGLSFTSTEKAVFQSANQMERQRLLMDKLSTTVGGYAQTMTGSAIGAQTQFNNATKAFSEEIGKLIDKPVGDFFRRMTAATKTATQEFDALSPRAKSVIFTLGTGATGIAATASAITGLAGTVGVLQKILPTVAQGFTTLGKVGASGFTTILIPVAAVAAGIAGMILIIGAFKQAWDADLGGMRETFASWGKSITDAFKAIVEFVQNAWNGATDFIVEKLTLIKAMAEGASPDEAGARVRENQKAVADVGKDVGLKLTEAAIAAKDILGDVFSNAGDGIKGSWDAGMGVLKDTFGPLFDKMFGGLDKYLGANSPMAALPGKLKGAFDDLQTSLAALTSGAPLKATTQQDLNSGNAVRRAFGGGKSGEEAAAQFFRSLEAMSGLSAETLNVVVADFQKAVGGAGQVAALGPEFANSLAQVVHGFQRLSDGTVNQILALNNGNMQAVTAIATATKGVSQQQVDMLVAATQGSVDNISAIVEATKGMTDEQVAAIVTATQGNVAQIQQMAADFKRLPSVTAEATARATAAANEFGSQYYGFFSTAAQKVAGFDYVVDRFLAKTRAVLDKLSTGAQAFAGVVGQKALGSNAAVSSVTQGAVQGGLVAGPAGAIGGAIGGIAAQAPALMAVMERLGNVLAKLAEPFNAMFAALNPVLDALMPIFNAILGMFTTLVEGLRPVFDLLATVLRALAPIISVFVQVVGQVLGQLLGALEPVISAIMPVVQIIGNILTILAPLLNILVVAVQPLIMPIRVLGRIMQTLLPVFTFVGQILTTVANVVMIVFRAVAAVYNGIVDAVAWIIDLFSFLPFIGDDIHDAAEDIRKNWKINLDTPQVDNTDLSYKPPEEEKAKDDNTKAVIDSTSSIKNMGDTAAKVTQQLANAPSGFSIALARFQALVGQANPRLAIAGAAGGGGGMNIATQRSIVNNVTIVSNDPAKIYSQMKALEEQQNFLNTGSPITSSTPYVNGNGKI